MKKMIGSVLMAAVLLSACNKSKDQVGVEIPVAGLMAINLAPDISTMNILLSGNNLTNAPLAFTNFTGGYLRVYTGDRTVSAYSANLPVTSSNYTFDSKKFYSLFVVGANANYKNVIAYDHFDSLKATPGKAYIRYINAIPDSSDPKVTITANGSNVVEQAAAFASISDFTEVSTGEVAVAINNEGNIQANRTITLEERKVYTVLLIGVPESTDPAKAVQIKFIENGKLAEAQQQ